MKNRVLLIGLFLLLSSGNLRAKGITLLSAQEYVNQVCNANGVVDSMSQWVSATTTVYSCDVFNTLNFGVYYGEVLGSASAVLSKNPTVDVTGYVQSEGPGSSSYFGEALLDFSVALVETHQPPEDVPQIPIIAKPVSFSDGLGNYKILNDYATITGSDGNVINLPLNATDSFDLTPGATYKVELNAGCMATSTTVNLFLSDSSCQSVVDPVFQFDQAAFNAEMGSNTFPLNKYYGIEYSSNLTQTPEPSSLVLMGSGLVGLVGLLRRRIRW